MSSKPVEPQLGAESFSCPHCGAYAQQYFFKVFVKSYDKGKVPSVLVFDKGLYKGFKGTDDKNEDERWLTFLERFEKHSVTYWLDAYGQHVNWELNNVFVSMCHSCDGFAVWVEDRIVYPIKNSAIMAHEEMPAPIRRDFEEAASIVDNSPRGAAALLRLCIEKIVIELGGKGDNLNNDIGELVRKGVIDTRIQQALDLVRFVGNNAVHPGQIDLKDDKPTAMKLFNLINVIVESTISAPKHVREMYETLLPEASKAQIEKRDAPTRTSPDAPSIGKEEKT
jgi:hypothetical protein